ncbi:hypothetical protein [Pseudomethylobacillus aquaticus]|uniref:hypothetical protein n=1 Tax=Pseudomethylobacillus aquaticus TaxID=2676064 RepID=UPI0011CE6520|nr:hypothetical protein [Pseudomethylobacillus aquaticus]
MHRRSVSHRRSSERLLARCGFNRWIKAGLLLLLFGWGPLLLVLLASWLGLWQNLDPVGLGLLFVVTLIPALACLGIGLLQSWINKSE